MQRAMGRAHARIYRASGGRLGRRWFSGAPVMVLETTGRRTGARRRTAVLYLRHGDALVVMAANAGASLAVRPRELSGAERGHAWRAFVELYPQAEHYARFTERELPLIALEPAGP